MPEPPNASDPCEPPPWAARLTALEELLTHVQRTLEDIHDVVLAQQKQLDGCDVRLKRLERDVPTVARSLSEDRDPEEERPPHY